MNYDPTTPAVRRRLAPGVLAGLLAAQFALSASATPALSAAPAPVSATDAAAGAGDRDSAATAAKTEAADAKAAKEAPVLMDEVTVTGSFRGSLIAAAEMKQSTPTITEVIAAEDIGKLPDVSIADSLTRLTGLTTQRTNGRSQAISIRGLTGDYSTGMLNGREQVSTGLNRAVEFDQYPAELLSEVVVYKTADASLAGQGLAGTINLRTVHPLSRPNRTIAANAYYQWTEMNELTPGAEKDGQRVNLSYVDQFADRKVGLALGYAHTSTPFEGQQFQAWGYPTDSAGNYALGGTKSYVRTSNLDRDGVVAVLEFRPNENLHSTFDFFASEFEETQLLRGLEIPLAFWSSAQLQPGYTTSGGLITNATLTNVQPVVRNDIVVRSDDLLALGWNLELGNGNGWTTTFDAGYSRIKRNDRNLETYSGLGFAQGATTPDRVTVKLTPGEIPVITPTVDYSNASLFRLTDPQGWGTGTLPVTGMQGYLKHFDSKDELGELQLKTKHPLENVFTSIEVGSSYTDRYKRDGEKPTGFIFNKSLTPTAPLPPIIGRTDMTFLGLGHVYAYDPLAAYENGLYGFYANPNNDVVANRWSVREKVSRLYVKADLEHKLGSVPVTGNIGLQVIRANQSAQGNSAIGSGGSLIAVPVSGGAKYTDVAPNLNFTLKPQEDLLVRLAAARQIARPRMFDMRASRNFSYNPALATSTTTSPWSGDGGNPQLKPWKSDSFDVSIEKYFKDNHGYVSVAAFHKKLKSYIYEQPIVTDFTGYPTTDGSSPVLRTGTVTMPTNGTGGTIKGVEFTLSLASEMISPEFRGFGVVLGGAYTDSSIKPWGPTSGDAPIAGLSKRVANVTIYYERHGFSARVSQRYRSEYRGYITNFGAPNFKGDVNSGGGFSMAQPESVLDAQLSYSLQTERLKGLTFFLQAYNLNNEPLITYANDDPRQVTNYQKYGASYSAGVAFKF